MGCQKNTNPNQVTFIPPATGSCMTAGCGYNAANIMYTGPALTCVGSPTNTNLQSILLDIDAAICGMSGTDWSMFEYNCLDDQSPITTPEIFVNRITAYACDTRADFDTFVTVDYVADQDATTALINSINLPGITSTCPGITITPDMTNSQVHTSMMTSLCALYTKTDISLVDWDQCYIVVTPPTDIAGGFNLIIDQVCDLKASIASITPTLPLFNNIGTCLPGATATDSLYDTVVKTRDVACSKASFDVNKIIWTGCITKPVVDPTQPIEDTFTSIITKLQDSYARRIIGFSTDFVVTQQTPGDTCSGFLIALSPTVGATDKFVAVDAADPTPGYLINKIQSGTGVSLDTTTTPGRITISSSLKDEKIKADATDTNPADFLSNKIEGSTDQTMAITLSTAFSTVTNRVRVNSSINYKNLVSNILTAISGDANLLNQFCSMVCNCDCTTSSTTTAAPGSAPTVRFIISSEGGQAAQAGVRASQLNPTVMWYDNPDFLLGVGNVINTGTYTVTTPDVPSTGSITLLNNVDRVADYAVRVEDDQGAIIAGATSQAGTLTALGTLTIPMIYGDRQNAVVKITFNF